MLQYVSAVYQRIMRLPGASARRSVSLNVDALEDRCTPAISAGLLPLLHPPETVMIAQASFVPELLHAEPALAVNAQPGTGARAETSLVRTDLFGGAGDEQTEEESDDFGPIHESAFDWNVRPQPKASVTETAARTSDAEETRDHRRDNHEAERMAPCVVLEFDAEAEAE
jgi:hypothetical protein